MIETLESLNEQERQMLARCINRLLDETFILRQFERDEYYFVRRHQDALRAYLELADWELVHDDLNKSFRPSTGAAVVVVT